MEQHLSKIKTLFVIRRGRKGAEEATVAEPTRTTVQGMDVQNTLPTKLLVAHTLDTDMRGMRPNGEKAPCHLPLALATLYSRLQEGRGGG